MTYYELIANGQASVGVTNQYRNVSVEEPPHLVTHMTSENTLSGQWKPFILNKTPEELSYRWAKQTYDYAMDLIQNDPTSALAGITTTYGFNMSAEQLKTPYWANIPYDFEEMSNEDLRRFPPSVASGFKFTTVFIESRKFISWLMEMFSSLGGKIKHKEIKGLQELSEEFDVVVNCTGYGAKSLLNDIEMIPVRGQVMRVKAPWVKNFITFDNTKNNTTTYILPNQDQVILGGTTYANDSNTEINANDKEHILRSCCEMLPSLEYAQVIGHWVGLRPGRSTVRVEREDLTLESGKVLKVIHNYGHGGGGITLHRGCALDAVKHVEECLKELAPLTLSSKL